jgi:cystinosin
MIIIGFSNYKVTFCKYLPQALMNYRRKSTDGWSIENVILDFIGGVLSITQMILLAYNFNDYGSISGSPTKFGLGLVTIIYDVIFMAQHYILYVQPYARPTSGMSHY